MRESIRFGIGRLLMLATCLSLAVACGGGGREDPILRLSSEEAFTEGQRLMADEKYLQAREHFAHAFQTAPNSEVGRDALLLQADAFFLEGGEVNLVRAEAKYRDFNNRYPISDKAAYVQHQVAKSLALRMRKADRDQSETRDAIAAFEELISLYPTSEHVAGAEEEIARLRSNLARHEYLVARYQLRRGLAGAAKARLTGLLEEYPDYEDLDLALWSLGLAHHKLDEADEAATVFARLRAEHPESEYLSKIPSEYRG